MPSNAAEMICGSVFAALILGMAIIPHGIGQFVYDYQTILAGTIGATIAVAAALIAWMNVQKQIGHQDKLEDQRRHRAGFAARASLPLALSYYCSYASECMKFLVSLRSQVAEDAVEVVLLPEDVASPPELSEAPIVTLTECIRHADQGPREVLANFIGQLQIQRGRLASEIPRWKRLLFDDHAHVSVHEIDERILDAAETYARASALLSYARRGSETVSASAHEREMFNALWICGIRSDEFPTLHESVVRRFGVQGGAEYEEHE